MCFIFTLGIYYCQEDITKDCFENFCNKFVPKMKIQQIKGYTDKNICLVFNLPEFGRDDDATELRKQSAKTLFKRHGMKGILQQYQFSEKNLIIILYSYTCFIVHYVSTHLT